MLPIKIQDDAEHTANVTETGQLEVSVTGVSFPDATLYIPGFATEVTLDLVNDGITAMTAALGLVSTNVTSAAILAKLPTGGAIALNQTTGNSYLNSIVTNTSNTNTSVQAVTAKLSADPSTASLQSATNSAISDLNLAVDDVKTAVNAVTSKLIVAPATEAKQDTIKSAIDLVTAKIASASTTIGQYNIVMTTINTEYSQALPTGCRGFEFWTRSGELARFAFTTGKVAGSTDPYFTLRRGATYQSTETLDLTGKTLYVASATAGDVVELITWS